MQAAVKASPQIYVILHAAAHAATLEHQPVRGAIHA